MSALRLPVADAADVRRRFGVLLREHGRAVGALAVVQLSAALASAAIPRVLGLMVDAADADGGAGRLGRLIVIVIALAAANALLTGGGEYLARILG